MSIPGLSIVLVGKFRDGVGDGIIQTAVECSVFVDLEARIPFAG